MVRIEAMGLKRRRRDFVQVAQIGAGTNPRARPPHSPVANVSGLDYQVRSDLPLQADAPLVLPRGPACVAIERLGSRADRARLRIYSRIINWPTWPRQRARRRDVGVCPRR